MLDVAVGLKVTDRGDCVGTSFVKDVAQKRIAWLNTVRWVSIYMNDFILMRYRY